jgi:transcriptional regulator with XRE-family HTH domain
MGKERRKTFIRTWRLHRRLSLETVADAAGTTAASLSRIERGIVPYNQDLIESLALIYGCDPAELIARDPSQPARIWSLWERASDDEKARIATVAEAMLNYRPAGEEK